MRLWQQRHGTRIITGGLKMRPFQCLIWKKNEREEHALVFCNIKLGTLNKWIKKILGECSNFDVAATSWQEWPASQSKGQGDIKPKAWWKWVGNEEKRAQCYVKLQFFFFNTWNCYFMVEVFFFFISYNTHALYVSMVSLIGRACSVTLKCCVMSLYLGKRGNRRGSLQLWLNAVHHFKVLVVLGTWLWRDLWPLLKMWKSISLPLWITFSSIFYD